MLHSQLWPSWKTWNTLGRILSSRRKTGTQWILWWLWFTSINWRLYRLPKWWVHIQYNTIQYTVQSFGTKTCGLHAVYYLQHRIKGEDIEEIVKTFDSVNKLENDSIVVESLMKKEKNRLFQWNHIFTQTCLPFYPDWFAWLPWGRWMDVTPRIRTRHSPDMRKGPLLLLSRSRQRVVLEVVRDDVDPAWNQFPWVYCHYLFPFPISSCKHLVGEFFSCIGTSNKWK